MDRFHTLTVFVAVAEEQGFAAGARRLNMSPPAVTRAMSALEAHLGVKLLSRSTRHVRITEAGQRYLDDARRILGELDAADEAAAGVNAQPRGHLAVTAPVLFGRMFVMPNIVEYLQRFADTHVSAVFLDRNVNMLDEGLDVAVRIGELPDSSLRAVRVGTVRVVTCASPRYFEVHGEPQTLAQLNQHSIITSTAANNALDWRTASSKGGVAQGKRARLRVTTNDAAIEAALCDFGIVRLLSYQLAPQLRNGELKIVLQDHEPPPRPIHIVHREGRYASAKVRTFVDLMVERLRAEPSLN